MTHPNLIRCLLFIPVVCSLVGFSYGLKSECNVTGDYIYSKEFRDGSHLSRCLWYKYLLSQYVVDWQRSRPTKTELELWRMRFIRNVQALMLRSHCTAGGMAIAFNYSEFPSPYESPWKMAGYERYRINYKDPQDIEYTEEEDESWDNFNEVEKAARRDLMKNLRAYIVFQVYTLKALRDGICRGNGHGLGEIHLNKYSDRTCKELEKDPSSDKCQLMDHLPAPPKHHRV